jgi:hypothetical protein
MNVECALLELGGRRGKEGSHKFRIGEFPVKSKLTAAGPCGITGSPARSP